MWRSTHTVLRIAHQLRAAIEASQVEQDHLVDIVAFVLTEVNALEVADAHRAEVRRG